MSKDILQKFNARRIIVLIRTHGPLSRLQLTQMLGVTPSTVTRLVNQMMDINLLTEFPNPEKQGQKGFPAKLLRFVSNSMVTAGVFFDPDRIFTCIADFDGNPLSEDEIPITERSFEAILNQASKSIHNQIKSLDLHSTRIVGCGVSYPGQHTEEPGRILKTKQFANWPNVDVLSDLQPFFDFPVYQINDAKAACLGEMLYGACKPYQNFCYVWLSYGIGGGAVINQNLYLGNNLASAEFGGLFPKSKMRPSGQHLLDTLRASGHKLKRLDSITEWHLELPEARQWVDEAAEKLQWLSLVIARTFAPEAIVFGGTLNATLIDEIQSRIASSEHLGEDFLISPPKILRASTDHKPQLGAAALAIHQMLSPSKFLE